MGEPIESALGIVRAAVECADINECSGTRTLMSGVELGLSIEVTGQPPDAISIRTDNPDLLELDGFATENDVCRTGKDTRVKGRLRFEGLGEASVIVMNGREEIDRFTWSVSEPAELSVHPQRWEPGGLVDLGAREQLELEVGQIALLRAQVTDGAGQRLLAGPRFVWSFDGHPSPKAGGSSMVLERDMPAEVEVEVAIAGLTQRIHVTFAAASSE